MLDGRVAICTGSGRGVGGEVAKLMAAHGAKVVVNDPGTTGSGEGTDTTPAQEIVDQIKAAGGDAVANYGYVNKFDDCLQMVSQARDTFGGLHIVFNAAGILRDKMFHNMFPEDWQAVIDVHLTGHFNLNRAAINLFREQNYGRMILVSSTSGLLGNVGQANYGSAKFGIVALARIIAMENQSRGITANVIAPSADTRMTRSVPTPKDPAAAAAREERLRRSRADAIAPLMRVSRVGAGELRQRPGIPSARRRIVAVRPYAAGADGASPGRLDAGDDRRGRDAVAGQRVHLARLAQYPCRIADGVSRDGRSDRERADRALRKAPGAAEGDPAGLGHAGGQRRDDRRCPVLGRSARRRQPRHVDDPGLRPSQAQRPRQHAVPAAGHQGDRRYRRWSTAMAGSAMCRRISRCGSRSTRPRRPAWRSPRCATRRISARPAITR